MSGAEQVAVAWWLRGATAQTLWARLARSRHLVTVRARGPDHRRRRRSRPRPRRGPGRRRARAPAARPRGERALAAHPGAGGAGGAGRLALARCSTSAPARAIRADLASAQNRRPRLYHSGDTADLDLACARWPRASPTCRSTRSGFRWGGTSCSSGWARPAPASAIRGAATISVPYDLAAASRYLERAAARFYTYHFLRRLKPKALDVLARFPRETAHLDAARIRRGADVRRVRRAGHGADARVRQRRGLLPARQLARLPVAHRACPTLCISSEDDPFYPRDSVARRARGRLGRVTFEVTPWGGHTGFVSGPWPWRPRYWAEERVVDWLGELHAGATEPVTALAQL